MGSNLHIVTYMHQVIQLHSFRNPRIVQRPSVNRSVPPNLHIVRNLHQPRLRKFPITLAIECKSKPIRSQHRSRMNLHTMSDAHSRVKRHSWVNSAVFSDPASRSNHTVRSNLRAISNVSILADPCIPSDTPVPPNPPHPPHNPR